MDLFTKKEPSAHSQSHHGHDHTHGALDPAVLTTKQGIRAVQLSFLVLLATTLVQVWVVYLSGSVALLADTIHNFGDAATAFPLWVAFAMARRKPTKSFSYGFGRVEDLAGVVIVLTILSSGLFAGYEAVTRLLHPPKVDYLGAVVAASIIGFIGNEVVAYYRLKVGNAIGSAALIADGHHARIDGFASLAVLFGAVGVWLGFPLADPLIGVVITAVLFKIVWDSGKSVFMRLLDGVDPEVIDEVTHAAQHVPGILDVTEVRVRWLGHRLLAEINIAVDSALSVEQGHEIAKEVRHQLLHHLKYLGNAIIHIDPVNASGEEHHHLSEHSHGNFAAHSH
ncbi:MAG: cation diffusion facilitator family transporter [Nitrospira sp.]